MAVEKAIASSSLVEVVDRVVVAGVETFLKYAEAVGLLPEAATA
jgi:hypothetical protein